MDNHFTSGRHSVRRALVFEKWVLEVDRTRDRRNFWLYVV